YGSFEDKYDHFFFEELIYLPGKMASTYIILYFLLPKFLLPGKYREFFSWLVVSSFASGIVQRYIWFNIDYPIYYPQALADSFFYFPKIVKMIVAIYPVTFVAVAIKLLKYWYANQQAQQVLTQEKLQAELTFLKSQIHPH